MAVWYDPTFSKPLHAIFESINKYLLQITLQIPNLLTIYYDSYNLWDTYIHDMYSLAHHMISTLPHLIIRIEHFVGKTPRDCFEWMLHCLGIVQVLHKHLFFGGGGEPKLT